MWSVFIRGNTSWHLTGCLNYNCHFLVGWFVFDLGLEHFDLSVSFCITTSSLGLYHINDRSLLFQAAAHRYETCACY